MFTASATGKITPAFGSINGAVRRGTISIVVPCLNEESVVGEFVDWCKEGLAPLGRECQILIVDSSTDHSAAIAEEHGAEVLRVPRRGLGRAYIDARPHIRGDYVIMGDCDLTYDFRDLRAFVDRLDAGDDFVMGSRFKGYIEQGAMPPLHRYFGTPATTWLLNFMYGTRYSDIHCGMRALTRDALSRMQLRSQSWEYAAEMVLKAARLGLRIAEVPVRFYKDRESRVSHHKREGWLSPWKAGWQNVRSMFVYAPDFFLLKPGIVMLCIGVLLVLSLAGGPLTVHGFGLDLHAMLVGVTLATLGYNAIHMAILARNFYSFQVSSPRLLHCFTYDRGMVASGVLGLLGAGLFGALVFEWVRDGLRLANISYVGILGLLFIILAFQTFTFTLLHKMIDQSREGRP